MKTVADYVNAIVEQREALPIPAAQFLRNMTVGQVCAFQCEGRQPNAQTNVTSIARRIGGKFTTKIVLVVEPLIPAADRMLLVTCVENPRPKQKCGRKPKNNVN
jgi:hypothetical protein